MIVLLGGLRPVDLLCFLCRFPSMSVCLSEDQMCSTPHTCSICSICMYVAGDGYVPLSGLRIPPWCSVQCKAPIADLTSSVRREWMPLRSHSTGTGNLRHFWFHVVGYVTSRMYVCHARRYEVETRIHKGFHHANPHFIPSHPQASNDARVPLDLH